MERCRCLVGAVSETDQICDEDSKQEPIREMNYYKGI